MNFVLVVLTTLMLYATAFAEGQNLNYPVPGPKAILAPLPKAAPKPDSIYCQKTTGVEKLCIPKHKSACACAKE